MMMAPITPEAASPMATIPSAAPMLPPFTGSIHRVCQRHRCFAIIAPPPRHRGTNLFQHREFHGNIDQKP